MLRSRSITRKKPVTPAPRPNLVKTLNGLRIRGGKRVWEEENDDTSESLP